MRYIAAYLLLQQAGNTSPSANDIKQVISAVGIDVDEERLNGLLGELKGKDINELIAEGSTKLSSVPSGGGGGGAGGAAAGAAAAAGGAPAAAEEKKEEAKEEAKEESDDDMGFGLFD